MSKLKRSSPFTEENNGQTRGMENSSTPYHYTFIGQNMKTDEKIREWRERKSKIYSCIGTA